MNRVKNILTELNDQKRDKGYWDLYHQIHPSGGAPPLNTEETAAVLKFLRARQRVVRERGWLWKLLIYGTPSPTARDYAVECLAQEDTYIRGLAFFYLKLHYKSLLPDLVRCFADDPSPHVRYEIAGTMADPARRRILLEQIIPDVGYDHELADAIQIDLADMGSAN